MGEILMSRKESTRDHILHRYKRGEITLKEAALQLNISYRHAKRLWLAYKNVGVQGLLSKKRGKCSNRVISHAVKDQAIELLKTTYAGFGPKLAAQKLKKVHNLILSKETVRKLMIKAHLWIPHKTHATIHQRRVRREKKGELLLADASNHAWFENRGPHCSLHAFIDDATSCIGSLYFAQEECTMGYMQGFRLYVEKEGIPQELYVDRHSTFKVNHGSHQEESVTQFARAVKELEVRMIYARTPQAKGRVERLFKTLQDRLVKELRLRGIQTIEEANSFLPEYIKEHNQLFGKQAQDSSNAHRPINRDINLDYILCNKETRIVTKNLEISYNTVIYQIDPSCCKDISLRGVPITVITTFDNQLILEYQNRFLKYKTLKEVPFIQDSPPLLGSQRRRIKPSKNHPWFHSKLSA